jgi:hypothetical protein
VKVKRRFSAIVKTSKIRYNTKQICRTNQKRDIQEQDREKDEQALSLRHRLLLVVQIAKA